MRTTDGRHGWIQPLAAGCFALEAKRPDLTASGDVADIALSIDRPRCDPRAMTASVVPPPFDQFLATAEEVAQARPDVDLEVAREIFLEVATMLDNGLALDGLDDHDAAAVVAGLCVDQVADDPGAAVRAHAQAVLAGTEDLHNREGVSASYQIAARILQL
jgi:hypothetical protein